MQPRTLCLGESRAADESQPEHEEAYRRKPPSTYAYTSVPSAHSVVSHTKQYAAGAWGFGPCSLCVAIRDHGGIVRLR